MDLEDHERVDCSNDKELLSALDGDTQVVKSVSLSRIKDASLIARVCEFKNLTSLFLSLCEGSQLASRLEQLPALTSVNFQACRLTEFPIELRAAKSLTKLSLGNNGIESIPAEIGRFLSLKEISVSQNRIAELPDELFELQLESLNVTYNQLNSLNSKIGQLTSLRDLFLSVNSIKEVPSTIGLLRSLERISLGHNQLNTLPAEIADLKKIQYLSIEHNPFETLPDCLIELATSVPEFKIDGTHRTLFMDWSYQHSSLPPKKEIEELNVYLNQTDDRYQSIAEQMRLNGTEAMLPRVRKSISVRTTVADDGQTIGCSRLGGFPDLASEEQLPRSEEGIWIFLAQFNLADLAPLNDFLPKEGLLSFFVKSLEDFQAVVLFQQDPKNLKTVRFNPDDLTDDQDDYTDSPFRVEFSRSTSLPYSATEDIDESAYEVVRDKLDDSSGHVFNGYTYTQHETPETVASNQLGGSADEWVSLLQLGWDKNVGFCFWDAGTLTFSIHQENLRRHDFSQVHVLLESS